jgi:hypothetical protein
MPWNSLISAAAHRRRVRLMDGREGTLVYAPNGRTTGRPVRHGDRTQCGVQLDGGKRGHITSVPPEHITYVYEEGENQ